MNDLIINTLLIVYYSTSFTNIQNALFFQGICDGASSIIVASEKALVKHNLTPLARLVGYGLAGVDPTIMGIGPAYAIRNLLSITSMTMENIDMFEVCKRYIITINNNYHFSIQNFCYSW